MKFPKPRKIKVYPLELTLNTIYLLEQYSNYCNLPVNEIAEIMLSQLIEDQGFNEYIFKKRDNKRLLEILNEYYPDMAVEKLNGKTN